MADNVTYTNTGTGAVPNATVVRARELPNGSKMQEVDVAPMVCASVSGSQYAQSIPSTSAFTPTVPSGATHMWLSVDPGANTIRWTRDGTTPTTAIGHTLVAGDSIELDNPGNIRLRSTTGTSTVQISYHRYI